MSKVGGTISFVDKKLTMEGEPNYKLPEDLTVEFATEWLSREWGDEFFIGELMAFVTPSEKRRFNAFCRTTGGDLWTRFCVAAVSWSSLLNSDNTWHIDTMDFAYERKINFPLVSAVYVTVTNFRLLATPRGVLSFEEFRYRYGRNLRDYLLQHRAEVTDAVDDVLLHAFSPLRRVRASVVDADGHASYRMLVGPESLALRYWKLPSNCTVLTTE